VENQSFKEVELVFGKLFLLNQNSFSNKFPEKLVITASYFQEKVGYLMEALKVSTVEHQLKDYFV
jgi:hypothetical protein